jgi:hypothetical protein
MHEAFRVEQEQGAHLALRVVLPDHEIVPVVRAPAALGASSYDPI